MSHTIVVVPCYNEAQRLPVAEFQRFARYSDCELLFVNDGSQDGTGQLLDDLAAQQPRFQALHLQQNCGKAEAVRRGTVFALAQAPDYVGYWDADLATPLETIDGFRDVLERRDDVELVVGSRLQLLGHRIQRKPVRRWLSRLFAMATSLCLGVRIRDTQCGAKLFRVGPDVRAAFAEPFQSRWIFDVEILARLARQQEAATAALSSRIYEFALDRWQEVPGSKLRSGDFLRAAGELASIYWRYLRPLAPAFQPAIPAAAADAIAENVAPADERRAA